ncbi:uncharacterized protein LTR77_009011 [Saxophila tyrrhenica]|uniref:Phosphoglycerate mutase-like protein n=1 Tax=Saxophila tyrrhenica TaxID=1690608 RepID=A0AAV9P3F9_9PEZI|nr:hypothetical protein LTR77_009011 [Saxophila tyrrhenica]
MLHSILPLLTFLLPTVTAQSDARYTVWASVIFSRTGERTPEVLGSEPVTLTSVGARQQELNGHFFRQRYFESFNNFSTDNGVGIAPLPGMNPQIPDVQKLYVQALDEQSSVASAQAFLQGLYPPVSFSGNASEVQAMVDPSGRVANGSYVDPPLGGYRYAQVHTSGQYDPEFVYVGGSLQCPAFVEQVEEYIATPDFADVQAATLPVYQKIGPAFLGGVLSEDKWGFVNAYAIYDYLSYQNAHNTTASDLFASDEYTDPDTGASYIDTLRSYANQQQYAWFGNLYAENPITGTGFENDVKGSISTIAGNTLAAKMLNQLQTAIIYGGEYYQLSLLFGDYEPLLSLFALTSLPSLDSDFYGIPDFGSVAVFELFSIVEPGTVEFPDVEDLWVRFYFRNGTDINQPYRAYSLFNYGPDTMELKWTDFQEEMLKIVVGDIGQWCQQCGASYSGSDRIFCSYWNASDSLDAVSTSSSSGSSGLSPAVSGVIGAIIALVIAGLIFALLMLLAGVRFHRVKSHKSELGGFKGSQKLASDKDLTLPKGGAVVGATVVETPGSPVVGGHERVGSWELKGGGMPNIAEPRPASVRRASWEDDDVGEGPFRDPVKADERV